MGTHKNGPSTILIDNQEKNLLDYLNNKPLPYLFKILSVNKPLSIQVHPDKFYAKFLHQIKSNIYKDDNHKPELFICLSKDFELLFGFKTIEHALNTINEYKEVFEKYEETKEFQEDSTLGNYKKLLIRLIKLNDNEIKENLSKILEKKDVEDYELVNKLYKYYPDDLGILVALFMNHVYKHTGDSIYISANYPHAYIDGNCVEAMACSDNVIRLGLTPKYKDLEQFENILNYHFHTMIVDPKNDYHEFDHREVQEQVIRFHKFGIDDFLVFDIKVEKEVKLHIKNSCIFICIEGEVSLEGQTIKEGESFFIENDIKMASIVNLDKEKQSHVFFIAEYYKY
jgi:mannose-6-phosphate isomerase